MNLDLDGRVAVVAGGESAFGAVLARLLAANGAEVVTGTAIPEAIDLLAILAPPVPATDIAGLCERYAGGLGARRGRILVVTSAMGLVNVRGHQAAAADAAAALSTARSLAIDLAPRGICVNALALGAIAGDPAGMVSHTALGRTGTLEEAAAAALFLLDPQNSYMTGQTLAVDGGWAAGYVRDF